MLPVNIFLLKKPAAYPFKKQANANCIEILRADCFFSFFGSILLLNNDEKRNLEEELYKLPIARLSEKQKKAKEPRQNKVKETVAELKKVTWPTFPKVVKNTLLVLGIVLVFTVVLFGIDFGLSWLYRLLTSTL